MQLTRQHTLTWANALTLVRAVLVLPCAWMAWQQRWDWAGLLLSLAILTDLLDGAVARRMNQTSPFGGLADHTTDAVFVAMLLAALAANGWVPWPLPLLVLAAFAQYAADSRALAGRALRASALGRINGIGYFVLACVLVYRHALHLSWPPPALITALGWLLVISSVVSMIDRASARRTA